MTVMFFCKLAGAILVMGATGYFAINVNQAMESRKQQLRKLYSILLQLKSEIQYMCNTLPECFEKLSKNLKEPFSSWMKLLTERMEKKENALFSEVWNEGISYLSNHSALAKEDMEPLKELADKLGTADMEAQLKAIDYVLLHIEKNRTGLEEIMVQKKKVVMTLSLFCGFITLIFLL